MSNDHDSFLTRAHDPKVIRKVLASEIGALLYDAIRHIREKALNRESAKQYKHRLELDILKYARARFDWKAQELPLKIEFDVIDGQVRINLEGPLSVDVYVAIEEFISFGQEMSLPDFLLDEPQEEETAEADGNGWTYGR